MKTYRRHNCERQHRTFNVLARCMVPRAAWVDGEGEFALIAWCRVPTVSLWTDLADAESSKQMIDRMACGGFCRGRHEIVRLAGGVS